MTHEDLAERAAFAPQAPHWIQYDPEREWWRTRIFWVNTREHQAIARDLDEHPELCAPEITTQDVLEDLLDRCKPRRKRKRRAPATDPHAAPTVAEPYQRPFFADVTMADMNATQPLPELAKV